MSGRFICLSVVAGLLTVSFAVDDEEKPASARKYALIRSVDSVDLIVMKSYPEQIRVFARGTAATGGWSDAKLRQREAGKEGVYVFEFVARPPDGMATQALTPVEASTTFTKPPGLRRVRVVAATNSETAKIQGPVDG